eukprot:TRINITY_DN11843_c0_g2_i1.p1 TRINITY_DN11843_c0_g2~~TRINITY_DN11843_c0_g2_i1.p1  ORF type:complete len:448 (-),score=76.10 TRINITY_DN11843_c0_g2_i1:1221-2564(-)
MARQWMCVSLLAAVLFSASLGGILAYGGDYSEENGNSTSNGSRTATPAAAPVLQVRWCTVNTDESGFCDKILPTLSIPGEQEWSCVPRNSPQHCMDAIGAGEAELISMEAGMAYYAFMYKSMKAIMSERIESGLFYETVAVVRREICESEPGILFSELRGKSSCHGTYRSSAGWDLPIDTFLATLSAEPLAKIEGEPPDIVLVDDFFSKSCAPGPGEGQAVCTGCNETSGKQWDAMCGSASPYYGPIGAFRCLMEDMGDVAFTHVPIVQKYSLGGYFEQDWAYQPQENFMYICPRPGGGCEEVTENPAYAHCSLGKVPANVIMTRNAISEKDKLTIVKRLQQAGFTPEWSSAFYIGENKAGYLLSSTCVALQPIGGLTRHYLGEAGNASERIRVLNEQNVYMLYDELIEAEEAEAKSAARLSHFPSILATTLASCIVTAALMMWSLR